jgi:hypothetical protein
MTSSQLSWPMQTMFVAAGSRLKSIVLRKTWFSVLKA